MKILYLIDSLAKGGKERQLVELIKGLSNNANNQIELVLIKGIIDYKDIYKNNIKIHILDKNHKLDFRFFFKLNKICKKYKPDIIHSFSSLFTFFSIPIKLFNKIKLIDGSIRYAAPVKNVSMVSLLAKYNFYFSNLVIANSIAGLKAHRLNQNNKFRYIYNGFDFSRLKIEKSKNEVSSFYNIKTKYLIGMIARFGSAKDYRLYVECAMKILKDRNDLSFLCVGEGENKNKIKALIKPEFKNRILFLGELDNVEEIISILDICILTSNTNGHAEGISNSIMEYMAFSKPVIATKAGGNTELIVNDVTGYLIESFNKDELVDKINFLLNNKELRYSLGLNGKKRILEKFSLDCMVENYNNLYKEIYYEN